MTTEGAIALAAQDTFILTSPSRRRARARALILGIAAAIGGGVLGASAWPASDSPLPAVAAAPSPALADPPAESRIADVQTGARELECLSRAVYFEARGESLSGQAAVAQVVLNRVRHPAFPKTVCGVVYQGARSRGCQFSFACDRVADTPRESGAWSRAHQIAARALAGAVMPQVAGATHFHTTQVSPNWGPRLLRVAQVGLHVFYRMGGPPVRARAAPEPVEFTQLETAAPVEIVVAPAPEPEAPAPAAESEAADASTQALATN